MSTCEICDISLEHRLELVEHQASLSHQIRVEASPRKGQKLVCPVCNVSCLELAEYSKHVDSDSHIAKLRALRTKRIAMVDSCFPNKKSLRWPPGYRPPAPSAPAFGQPPPPPVRPNHFTSFFRPSVHAERPPPSMEQWNGQPPPRGSNWREDMAIPMPPHPQQLQQEQQPGPSNRQSIYKKDNRIFRQSPSRPFNKSPTGTPEKKKKKKKGVISKVLSSAAIVRKQKKKEIVTTPKVSAMDNKSKRYESLALKGMGMVASNKSRTQVMMMERQNKYALVDGQGGTIEENRGNVSSSSIPSITAPPPLPFSPPPLPRPPPSSRDISFAPSTASDSTYAFCHPVHSTPHQLSNSNWQEFVRGVEALQEDTPSTSSMPVVPPSPQQGQSASYVSGGLNMRKVKEEVTEEDDSVIITPVKGIAVKQEPPTEDTPTMDSLEQQISRKEAQLKSDYEEQQRKLSELAARRAETQRRFDEEMRAIDEEEACERGKMARLESNRASFRKDLQKVLQSHRF